MSFSLFWIFYHRHNLDNRNLSRISYTAPYLYDLYDTTTEDYYGDADDNFDGST